MGGISEAITISGRLVDLVKTGATIEAQEQIAELRLALSDAKIELSDLREEVSELKRAATLRAQMDWDGTLYWRKLADGQSEGPFCQRCLEADSKPVHLQTLPEGFGTRWICTVCNKTYGQQSGAPGPRSIKPHF